MLATLAQTRAQAKDVVNFAETAQKDHEQFARDLEKFAGKIGTQNSGAEDSEAEAGRARPGNFGNVFVQIKDELAKECLISTQRELLEKKGEKFDACYVGMQLAEHIRMIDALKVFEPHAPP